MSTTFSESIESQTESLLREHGEFQIPVRIRKLANKIGLTISQTDLDDSLSGALFANEKTILLNRHHPVVRKRFTIAHEVGHFQLHATAKKDFIDGIFKRDRNARPEDFVHEMQANQFAAALLMPRSELTNAFHKLDTQNSAFISELADKFRVSQESMTFRLLNLGLIVPTQ